MKEVNLLDKISRCQACEMCRGCKNNGAHMLAYDKIKKLEAENSKLKAQRLTEKDVRRIITIYGQLTSKYPDKAHLLVGDNTFISCSQYDDLAHAIIKEPESKENWSELKQDMHEASLPDNLKDGE